MEKICIVAAHPDDEVLGCGGVAARHAEAGDRVHVLIMAEGVFARADEGEAGGDYAADQAALRAATEEAAGILGTEYPTFADFPDNAMDKVPLLDVIKCIEQIIERERPDIVYTHHGGDLNIDHRIVHQAVLTACRPLPDSPVRAIYGFETVSSTEWASPAAEPFRPTRFVDVSGQMGRKLKALAAYDMEMRPSPHARSIENVVALATYRGASIGLMAAEAFTVIRERVT